MEPDYDAIIVGAGFGGIGAAIALRKQGLNNLAILERESNLGGTWHVNHYPGLSVDIASVTYSYSFAPNPHWSRMYAPGEELEKYAHHVVATYDLERHMQFDTTVTGAVHDDESGLWRVSIEGREPITARYLVAATGFLSQPYTPPFPGIETFTGDILHTADWDNSFDPTDRSIAVIGTGATAVQLIPKLAERARSLTVFQRTPIWVIPKVDTPIPAPVRRLFERVPATQRALRSVNNTILEGVMVVGVLQYGRQRILNRAVAAASKLFMRTQVRDRKTRKQLTPDYDFGCKRPTFSNQYFKVYNRSNTALETSGIDHFRSNALVAADGTAYPIDTVVLATGFNLWDTNFPAFEIIGREGRDLGKWWRDNRFQAYQGITVPKFPNFLSLNSPYSYNGLSYFTTIEGQMRHIERLFGEMRRRGVTGFEVTEEANQRFLDRMTENLSTSVFYAGDCSGSNSYYFNQHGEAVLLRPTSTRAGLKDARTFPLSDYTYAQ
ncbi:flavin-containing monooxygenase [Millisia brevis]|uniref:flavin-containing monooxygenase n=1 Tax=Millisia brevis TaxID=264148 RepID=UPI0008303789|nr:NAD(P)/FAD-dependent oxidoreductase [Millisia brevis]